MTIRFFQPEDATACSALVRRCIPLMQGMNTAAMQFVIDEATPKGILSDAAKGQAVVDVLEGQVVGMGMLLESEIKRVYIDPAYHRQGIGRRVMAALEDVAREQALPSIRIEASLNGIPFYEQLGYVQQEIEIFRLGEVEFHYMHMLKTLE
ncbi:GNAT family N-acetyltransferase [Phototrophicus methaneseepsis]|uniref:GNAT family N-acetyltransferase n=1 Tax=Phototrophicus methaneseepsis TaxID=2710758 RepID=A0A7S8IDE4_9CHLR|nr:GNAT family N-acetyltransferase [Phototrophicus methaneseepsis]QPC81451.1 GNAT family N-acetyltransferase [Phototrophicus methaneseepsis]